MTTKTTTRIRMDGSYVVPEAVVKYVTQAIAHREWRAEAEKAACQIARAKGAAKAAIVAHVRAEYDRAGAGFAGRWQG